MLGTVVTAMICRDAAPLLPLFLDGELDPHQMRTIALHSARCPACEQDLRRLERLQEVVSTTISGVVDEIDFDSFWPGIERRLSTVRHPWWQLVRAWWSEREDVWVIRLPAFAAAVAVAAFALFLFTRPSSAPDASPASPQLAAVDNATSIESLDSDVDSVVVLNDPETRTTVLWVNDIQPGDLP